MTTPTDADATARLFHETYERLAPSFGYETRKDSAVPWEQVPEKNRRLMIAVAGEVLSALLDGKAAAEREVADWKKTNDLNVRDGTKTIEALRTSLTRAEAALRELTTLYASADRSVWDDAIDRARAALPAQPKEGETR